MERRGEGFERERYVPEHGPQTRGSGVERERIVEPRPAVRPSEREVAKERPYAPLGPGIVVRARDLTSWGSVISGFFAALSLIVLIGVLGAAIGLQVAGTPSPTEAPVSPGLGAAVWAAITLIVSFFAGGWLAGRTAAIAGPLMGLIHGFGVWALTISFVLVLGAYGVLGSLGTLMGASGTPGSPSVMTAQLAGWGTFVALILGLAAAVFGGWIGGQNVPHEQRLVR